MPLLEPLKRALLPCSCLVCEQSAWGLLCEGCLKKWQHADDSPVCLRCAMPCTPYEKAQGDCDWCSHRQWPFQSVAAAQADEGVAGELLRIYKGARRFELVSLMSERLTQSLQKHPLWKDVEVLVPVPTNPWRVVKRGFDPAYELAAALAHKTGRTFKKALARRGWQASQTTLSRSARLQALKGAFVQCEALPEQGVALVDDLMTTGATLEAAARAMTDKPLMCVVLNRRL